MRTALDWKVRVARWSNKDELRYHASDEGVTLRTYRSVSPYHGGWLSIDDLKGMVKELKVDSLRMTSEVVRDLGFVPKKIAPATAEKLGVKGENIQLIQDVYVGLNSWNEVLRMLEALKAEGGQVF
jgi:hypothetical protein